MDRSRRRLVAVTILGLSIRGLDGAGVEGAQIVVAVSSNAPAFEEAVGAFKTALGEDDVWVFFVPLNSKDPSKSLIGGSRPRVVVAFGSRASEALALSDPAIPLLVTMVLPPDADGRAKPHNLVSTVSLYVNPVLIFSKLKSAFPDRKRLALLLGPNSGALRSELHAAAQRLGYVLEIVECSGPRDALEAFTALRGRADFVWCLPDSNLFPSAAIPPIILASIRNQLPVIGFSEGFVRAGAAVGFYPDYADIGVQTAETVKRFLSKQEISPLESPRKIRIAVNDRVLRILAVTRSNLPNEALVIR